MDRQQLKDHKDPDTVPVIYENAKVHLGGTQTFSSRLERVGQGTAAEGHIGVLLQVFATCRRNYQS